MRMEAREEKWDVYHKNDILWGEGITGMVTIVMAAT